MNNELNYERLLNRAYYRKNNVWPSKKEVFRSFIASKGKRR